MRVALTRNLDQPHAFDGPQGSWPPWKKRNGPNGGPSIPFAGDMFPFLGATGNLSLLGFVFFSRGLKQERMEGTQFG